MILPEKRHALPSQLSATPPICQSALPREHLALVDRGGKPVHVVLDSTGLKLYGVRKTFVRGNGDAPL